MVTREEANERYRNFLCVDCGVKRYSAGRTRCNECFQTYIERLAAGHG